MYKNVEICDICYRYVKDVTDEMKYWEENNINAWVKGRLITQESSIENIEEDKNEDSFEKFRKRMSTLKTSPEKQEFLE